MWWIKLKVMFWTGLLAVGIGGGLRLGANRLSYTVTGDLTDPRTGTRVIDRDRLVFFQEAGAWMILFGVIVLALVLHQWVSGDSKANGPPSPPPGSQQTG